MDLVIFLVINGFLLAFAVLSYLFWGSLGAFGGLIGAIFTLMTFQDPLLVVKSVYDPSTSLWVHESMAMGYFAWVPLILTALNFVVVLKHK